MIPMIRAQLPKTSVELTNATKEKPQEISMVKNTGPILKSNDCQNQEEITSFIEGKESVKIKIVVIFLDRIVNCSYSF